MRLAAVVGAIVLWALSSPTFAALTAAVTNNSSSAGTTSSLLTATDTASSSVDCTSSIAPISSSPTVACSRSTLPASVTSSGTSSLQVTLSSPGGVSPTVASMTASSCGPVSLADQSVASDPMLVRGGVTYAGSGPFSGSGSLGLDGSSALAADIVGTTNGTLTGTFSEGVWFKTAAGYASGGALIGFGSSASSVSDTNADKILSLTPSGTVNFALTTTLGTSNVASSGTSYADGHWHLAVATVSTTLGLTSAKVYVDGTQVASGGSLTLLTGYTGYWHAGWSPVPSGSAYLAGNESDAFAVDGTALSAGAITTLAGVSSQTTWNSDLSGDGASQSWGLGDAGTTTFSGTLPVIGSTDPCSMVSMAAGGGAFCVYSPNSLVSACATPTGASKSVAQWVAAGAQSFPATVVGTPAVVTTTLIRGSTYNTTFMPGLRLYVPVVVTEKLAAGSPWYTTLSWSATTQQVVA
jgi:hypothetical protein